MQKEYNKKIKSKFARLAVRVFGVYAERKTEMEAAQEGIDGRSGIIREMGLP